MHKLRIQLPACHGEVAHRKCIGLECGQRLTFGNVHHVVGGGVENEGRVGLRQSGFYGGGVADIHVAAVETLNLISALAEYMRQLYTQLSKGAENHCLLRTAIAHSSSG
jgi:hypothetical protein